MNTEITAPYQFQKGVSGNPKGKPKGTLSHSTVIRKALKKLAYDEQIDAKEIDIAVSYVKKALKGNTPILLDYMNRTFGVPKPQEENKSTVNVVILPQALIDKHIGTSVIVQDNS